MLRRVEHTENEINMYFEKEVGPGVLQTIIQQRCTQQEFMTIRAKSRHSH